MPKLPLTRCQFLLPFTAILTDIGAPTGLLLEKFRLPSSLEDKSDLYVPILSAISFAEAGQRTQGIEDFGFQAVQQLNFSHLSEKIQTLIAHSPTLLVALQHTCKWASIEDTNLNLWIEHTDDHVKICNNLSGTTGLFHLEHSQWLSNVLSIYIVRQFTGSTWAPATIAFEARYTPNLTTQSLWPNTRFLTGQRASWIEVPLSYLSLPRHPNEIRPLAHSDEDTPPEHGIIDTLKLMLPSYLDEKLPTIAEIAEMARISTRSFQRKLARVGFTYSDLIETVRFENARKLLRDTDSKIIEIAFSSGYTDPAHFARAFRRIAGVTPRQFREQSRL
jgi:AraC-like DNA-binding protein